MIYFFFSFHDFSQHILTKYVYTYIAPSLFIIPIKPLLSVIHFVNILLPLYIRQRLTANLFSFHAIHPAFPLFFSLLPYPTSSPTPKKIFRQGKDYAKIKMAISATGTIALIIFGVICLIYVTWFVLATIWAHIVMAMATNIRTRRVTAAAPGGAAGGDVEAGAAAGGGEA